MKLNFEMYIKKLHYYQEVTNVKTFKIRLFHVKYKSCVDSSYFMY